MVDPTPMIHEAVTKNRKCARADSPKGLLPNFTEVNHVRFVREKCFEGEKLFLCWRGTRNILNGQYNFAFDVEDVRSGNIDPYTDSK